MTRLLPAGTTPASVALRAALVVLPCAALALAPAWPHWAVVLGTVVGSVAWARTPDHAVGLVPIVLVAGWWSSRDVVDLRVLVVGVLLVLAHLAAVLASYGPLTLALDRRLAVLWARRAGLALVPLPVAWLAVRGLDPALAPPLLWLGTGAITVGLLVATARLVRTERA